MAYILSKPPEFFVCKGNKYVKLNYTEKIHEAHCTCSLQAALNPGFEIPPFQSSKIRKIENDSYPNTANFNKNPCPGINFMPTMNRPIANKPNNLQVPISPICTMSPGLPNFSAYNPSSPTHYFSNFLSPCNTPSTDLLLKDPALQLENEGTMLNKEFQKKIEELSEFSKDLTMNWTANRGSAGMNSEIIKNWSYLCTKCMEIQHMAKNMMWNQQKFIDLFKSQRSNMSFCTASYQSPQFPNPICSNTPF